FRSRLPRRDVRNLHRGAEADDPEVVLRVALVVLLPRRLADPRMPREVDARHRAVPAGLPRSLRALDVPVLVELRGCLSEVPDVAVPVLGVPVGRALLEPPAQIQP